MPVLNEHERGLGRQRRLVPHQLQQVVAQRNGDRDPRKHLAAVRDRRSRGDPRQRRERSNRPAGDQDAGVTGAGDPLERAAISGDHRSLELERCRDLPGTGAEIRPQGGERRRCDPRAARELSGALLNR